MNLQQKLTTYNLQKCRCTAGSITEYVNVSLLCQSWRSIFGTLIEIWNIYAIWNIITPITMQFLYGGQISTMHCMQSVDV